MTIVSIRNGSLGAVLAASTIGLPSTVAVYPWVVELRGKMNVRRSTTAAAAADVRAYLEDLARHSPFFRQELDARA